MPRDIPRTGRNDTTQGLSLGQGVLTMATHEVTFPITDPQEILKLRAGDEVTVQGHIIGIRDRTQIRIFDQGVEPPMDLRGAFLLHTAPGVRKIADGKYEKVCIGTTTSARMVRFTEPLGAQYGVRAICGKGGFPDDAIEPMREHGMVYFAIVGGAAALETTQIEEIEEVAWEELMPECLWKFRVKDFGPLTVGIDAHGNSLYHDVQAAAQKKTGGASLPASNDGFLDLPQRPGKPRTRRPHARHRQGPEPARHRGHVRHRRPVRRHRQARLGHELRHEQPREEDRALPLLRDAGRLRRHALRGRLRARPHRRVQELARRAPLLARRDLRRLARHPARAEARADRGLRARLHRPLRGRLEGPRRRLRALPVGRSGSRRSSTPAPSR